MTEVSAPSMDGTVATATAEGRGPTLLVVHPGGQNADSWSYVARVLAVEFRVVRLHRRIYATAAAPEVHSMAIEVADALAIADVLGGPIVLVGHSSGAVVALEAALARPGRFVGVVAYEPPMPTTTLVGGPALGRARRAIERSEPFEAMRIHLTEIVQIPVATVEAMLSDPGARVVLIEYASAQVSDNEAIDSLGIGIERYRSLSLPVVLIEGDQSPTHLRDRTADLAAVLPNAEVVTLADQGHIAHLSAPDLLADVIRRACRAWS